MGKEEDKDGDYWPQDGETCLRGVTVDLTGADKAAEDWQWDGETVLARVEAISTGARATWFALLGLLTFVLITLLSVEDIDFFGYGRATTLPLVNVDVPTLYFFWAAPPLTAAIFGQFHFYLIRHWDILRRAPAKIGGRPFGELAHPWLLTDMALRLRRDGAAAERALGRVTAATVITLTWLYGWLVMFYAWWRAMPAHDVWLTTLGGVCFAFVWLVGWTSFVMLWRRMRQPGSESARVWNWWRAPVGAVIVAVVAGVGALRTEIKYFEIVKRDPLRLLFFEKRYQYVNQGDKLISELASFLTAVPAYFQARWSGGQLDEWFARALIAHAGLSGAYIAIRPDGWKGRDEAEIAARRAWCDRRDMKWLYCKKEAEDFETQARHEWCASLRSPTGGEACDDWFSKEEAAFQAEWNAERQLAIAMLKKPELAGRDLRAADLWGAFLPGVDLRGVEMQGAVLSEAEMQGAVLIEAEMQGAVLIEAEMQGADLRGAEMQGADLRGAEMQGADLRGAEMQGAVLSEAEMQGAVLSEAEMQAADLRGAEMQGAVLSEAEMQGAVLSEAEMQGAVLSEAEMQGAVLSEAEMQGAVLSEAEMQGAVLWGANLKSADFSSAIIGPSLLKSADFTDVKNLSQAMLDEAVGNENTTLPLDAETGEQLYVWSCWSEMPELPGGVRPFFDPADYLCPKGEAPHKTGRSAVTGFLYGHSWSAGRGF